MRFAFGVVLLCASHAVAQPLPPLPKPQPVEPAGKPQPVEQPPSPPPPPAPQVAPPKSASPFDEYTGANGAAKEKFSIAKQQLRDGNQPAACTTFAEAYKLEEAISTQLNLARCRENEGKYAEAWRMFKDVVKRGGGVVDYEKAGNDSAAALEERLATIEIRLAEPIAPGTAVTVNDRVVDTAPKITELVDPGNVVVTAKGPTGVTSTRVFRVFMKNKILVDVPTLQERKAGRQPLFIAGSAILVVGGVLAIGAGSGGVRLAGGVAIAGGVAMFLLAPRKRVMVVPMLTQNAETGSVASLELVGRF